MSFESKSILILTKNKMLMIRYFRFKLLLFAQFSPKGQCPPHPPPHPQRLVSPLQMCVHRSRWCWRVGVRVGVPGGERLLLPRRGCWLTRRSEPCFMCSCCVEWTRPDKPSPHIAHTRLLPAPRFFIFSLGSVQSVKANQTLLSLTDLIYSVLRLCGRRHADRV